MNKGLGGVEIWNEESDGILKDVKYNDGMIKVLGVARRREDNVVKVRIKIECMIVKMKRR